MAKKELYRLGDVFKIPLADGVYGVGRILIVQSPCLFVGFYRIVLRKDESLDLAGLKISEYLLRILCGDLGFKKKEWEVIGNIPVEGIIELPFFWGKDAMTKGLYLRKYNPPEEMPLSMTGFEDYPSNEEEIAKEGAEPDGLFGWKAAEIRLKYDLEKAGLL